MTRAEGLLQFVLANAKADERAGIDVRLHAGWAKAAHEVLYPDNHERAYELWLQGAQARA